MNTSIGRKQLFGSHNRRGAREKRGGKGDYAIDLRERGNSPYSPQGGDCYEESLSCTEEKKIGNSCRDGKKWASTIRSNVFTEEERGGKNHWSGEGEPPGCRGEKKIPSEKGETLSVERERE